MFLNNDERWSNLRTHLYGEYGFNFVTFCFGVIISFICPVIFVFMNLLIGLILNGDLTKKTFYKIFKMMNRQLVIIYDLSLFKTNEKYQQNYFRVISGYLVYVLTIGLIGFIFLIANSNTYIREDLKASFLLNNSIPAAINIPIGDDTITDMEKLYKLSRARFQI